MRRRILAECEREALHQTGRVQAHGVLLVADPDGRVAAVSENVTRLLGAAPASWLGAPTPELLAVRGAKLPERPGSRVVVSSAIDGVAGPLDAVITRGDDGRLAYELIPQRGVATDPGLRTEGEELEDLDALVQRVADITGYDRVMYYRFQEDGDGDVAAEVTRCAGRGSYLGLRFPATDIPQVARRLYVKNPWRMIADAKQDPVELLSRDREPVDLTYVDLRSVSPVHRVYLGNMGVAASLSLPVVISGTSLAALVACHHDTPRVVSPARLERAALEVRRYALALSAELTRRRIVVVDALERRFDAVKMALMRNGDLATAWNEVASWLLAEFGADGVTLAGDEVLSFGLPLDGEALASVDGWLRGLGRAELTWATESVSREIEGFPMSEVAGVMALRIGHAWLYLVRREHLHEVAWGGDPDKPVEYHDGVLGIAPRRSFERWVERRIGFSHPWEREATLLLLRLRDLLLPEIGP